MDEEQLQHEKSDHIVLKRNFKGEYGWEARIFFDSDSEGEMNATIRKLGDIDTIMTTRYGQESG